MTWAKFDDRHDDRPAIKKAWRMSAGVAVGLHAMAVTHCARHESDGLIDPEWLAERLAIVPDRAGRLALAVLVRCGLFAELKAGEIVEVSDAKDYTVTVGPLDEDAHRVVDIFDYVDSSAYLADKRRKDARRKAEAAERAARERAEREARARGIPTDSERNGPGIQDASRGPDPTTPDPTRPHRTTGTPQAVPATEEHDLGRGVGIDAAGEREREKADLAISGGQG